jgi:protein-tyrosine phosphatase
MGKEIYWIEGSWPGRLAVGPRPRGGEWLRDDIAGLKRDGIETVLSLLTPEEEGDLDLAGEAGEVRSQRIEFISFPIADRQIPQSEAKWTEAVERVDRSLSKGAKVFVHCRQGIGRSGLLAACLLVRRGMSPGAAIDSVTIARGVRVPETPEQRDWIDHYAAALAGTV